MKRIIGLLFITFIFLPLLNGCWDKKELNHLAVATGLSIDKAEEGYKLSVQIVNPGEVSPQANASGVTPVTVRSETSKTMYETIRKLSLENPRRIYASHLQLLVISEEVAEEGISDALDYLSRDNDFREDFLIVIARKSKAEDLLKLQTLTETIPANALRTSLETSGKIWGESVTINLRELLDMLTNPGRNPVLSGIEIKGDLKKGETKANTETTDSPAQFNYLGLGVFDKDKLIGWLNANEGKGYNYISDKIDKTIEHINCPDGEVMSIEVMHSKTKLHANVDKDDKPKIKLNVRARANVGETDCKGDLTKPSEITKIEKLTEKEITKTIEETIAKVQEEYKADIFGFGEEIYRTHPKVWERIKENWGEHFANLDVQVKVNVSIKQLGTTRNSFRQDMKKE